MKSIEKMILTALLDRYERSRLFREGASSQRIQINVSRTERFTSMMEDADSKRDFLDALNRLRQEGVADFSWVRYEEGNLIERFWLITEPAALDLAYQKAGRMPKGRELEQLEAMMEGTLKRMDASSSDPEGADIDRLSDIRAFLQTALEKLRKDKKIPRCFFSGNEMDKNQPLLSALTAIASESGEQMIRVFSQRVLGDSKLFERELRPKVLMILRQIDRKKGPGGILSGFDERGAVCCNGAHMKLKGQHLPDMYRQQVLFPISRE